MTKFATVHDALKHLVQNGVTEVSIAELVELTGMAERTVRIRLTPLSNRRLVEPRADGNTFFIVSN